MVEDNREIKIVKKTFWLWQDELEETWLSDMASTGWHLVNIPKVSHYRFRKGSTKKVRYCLDYQNVSKEDENYKNIFKDAGWEHLDSMGGWQYFRKEYYGDEGPEIFSDKNSKLQKYYRILTFFGLLMLALGVGLSVFSLIFISSNTDILSFFRGFFIGAYSMLVLSFTFIIGKIIARIRKIKKETG